MNKLLSFYMYLSMWMIYSLCRVVVSQFILLHSWIIFCDGFLSHLTVSIPNKQKFLSSLLVFFYYIDRGVHQTPGTWFTYPKYPCLRIILNIQTMAFGVHWVLYLEYEPYLQPFTNLRVFYFLPLWLSRLKTLIWSLILHLGGQVT